mmetsp:Transcript_60243/g.136207  ORF Transcript_60243/g.136207 Transcript_60243/m.136207 type:complete len:231 (+) Transcript_60243:144-836(+)
MGNLFEKPTTPAARKPKPTISDADRATLDLKIARDKMKQYQGKLERECGVLLKRGQDCFKVGNKKKALYYMKVKKMKEAKFGDLEAQLLNLEKMVQTIEWTTQSMQVFDAMKKANGALEAMHRELPLERVQELMDDTSENLAYQDEIDRALAGTDMGTLEDRDLEAELNALEAETLGGATSIAEAPGKTQGVPALEKGVPVAPTNPILPAAPTTEPLRAETRDSPVAVPV